jgi:hypothetical protein
LSCLRRHHGGVIELPFEPFETARLGIPVRVDEEDEWLAASGRESVGRSGEAYVVGGVVSNPQ